MDCLYPTFSSSKKCDENNDKRQILIKLVSEIALKMTSISDIVYHFEDGTENIVNDVVKEANVETTTSTALESEQPVVFYYKSDYLRYILKKYNQASSNNNNMTEFKFYKRRLTHLVLLTDVTTFSNISLQIDQYKNIYVFICINHDEIGKTCQVQNEIFENMNSSVFLNMTVLKYTYAVFILNITPDSKINLFYVCFFCGEFQGKLQKIYGNSLDYQAIPYVTYKIGTLLDRIYKNFFNHTFRISYPIKGTYFYCNGKIDTEDGIYLVSTCASVTSKEGFMLTEISKRLNFYPMLSNPKFHNETGVWSNMILDVNRTLSDFAIGSISIAQSRQDKVLYSDAMGDDPLRVVFMIPENVFVEGLSIIFVFSLQTWVVLACTLLSITVLMFIANRFLSPDKKTSFVYDLSVVCCILVEQSIQKCEKIPGRAFLFSWLLCCIIICTTYKARLTAILVNPPEQHLATLNELGSDGYIPYLNEADGSLVTGYFSVSSDKMLRDLSAKSRVNLSICNVLKKSLTGTYLVIEEQVPIFHAVHNKCPDIMSLKELERIRVTKDYLFPSNHAWPFQKKSSYIRAFNYYIALFYENGLIGKWSESLYITRGGESFINFQTGVVKVSQNASINLYGLFFIWLFGIILALIVLITEFVSNKISKCMKKKVI